MYAGNTLLIDNFEFRTATPFVDVPADRDFSVGVAPDNSNSAADAIATFPVNFEIGKRYTVMAAGVVGSPEKPFGLFVDANARETGTPGFSSISTFHGLFTPFVLGIDVNERLLGNIFDNVDFGVYTPYADLANGDYFLDITLANVTDLLGTHYLDPALFSNTPARIFTSGILGSDSLQPRPAGRIPRWNSGIAPVAGGAGADHPQRTRTDGGRVRRYRQGARRFRFPQCHALFLCSG